MPKVVHFEIPAKNVKRAVEFYKKAFGWKISAWKGPMEYYLARTGKQGEMGIDGAIMKTGTVKSTVNTIGVSSLSRYIARIEKAGGKQVGKKQEIPGVGHFCYCKDTEGNLIGVLQPFPM